MYCSNCGTQISDNSKFCENCGAPLADIPVQQPAQPVPLPHKQPPPPKMNGCLMALLIGLGVVGSVVLLVSVLFNPGETLIFLLIVVLPVLLFFGLKKPSQILRWCKEPTRQKVVRWWAGASIVVLVIAIAIDTDFIYFLIVMPLVLLFLGLMNPALILQRSKEPTQLKAAGWCAGAFIVVLAVAIGINTAETNATGGSNNVSSTSQTSGTAGNLNWNLADDGTLTISGIGTMPDYGYKRPAPWSLYEKITKVVIAPGVTSIGYRGFFECRSLTSVIIPNSVTTIKEDAFYGCSGLTSITIPNSVTEIEMEAFRGCSGLTSVTIPNSITDIRVSTFRDCKGLTSVTIPSSVTFIGMNAFFDCNGLISVTIPESVITIRENAFPKQTVLKGGQSVVPDFGIGTWKAIFINEYDVRLDMTLTLYRDGTVHEKTYCHSDNETSESNGTWTLKSESHHDVVYQWIEIREGVYHDVDLKGNMYFPHTIQEVSKDIWQSIRDGDVACRFTKPETYNEAKLVADAERWRDAKRVYEASPEAVRKRERLERNRRRADYEAIFGEKPNF